MTAAELNGKVLFKRSVFGHQELNAEVNAIDIPALTCAALDNDTNADVQLLKAPLNVNYVANAIENRTLLGYQQVRQHRRD